jgi:hypothetical protein
VTGPAAAAWTGHDDEIAVLIGGEWHFVAPREGMELFDRAAGYQLVYRSAWEAAVAPVAPAGGTTIDVEARAAIIALLEALTAAGVLAPTAG